MRLLPDDDRVAGEYLRGVYGSVVLKDVVMRRGVRRPALLGRIVDFVADNVGSPTSAIISGSGTFSGMVCRTEQALA